MRCRGVLPVDENGEAVPPEWRPLSPRNTRGAPPRWTPEDCERAAQQRVPPAAMLDYCYLRPQAAPGRATAERVALFHYAIKSEEDFALKMERGGGQQGRKKTKDYALEINGCGRMLHASLLY